MAEGVINHQIHPMTKYTSVTFDSLSTGSNGYASLINKLPSTPAGYTLLLAIATSWTSVTPKAAFYVLGNGRYVISDTDVTITGLVVKYIFILSADNTSL